MWKYITQVTSVAAGELVVCACQSIMWPAVMESPLAGNKLQALAVSETVQVIDVSAALSRTVNVRDFPLPGALFIPQMMPVRVMSAGAGESAALSFALSEPYWFTAKYLVLFARPVVMPVMDV